MGKLGTLSAAFRCLLFRRTASSCKRAVLRSFQEKHPVPAAASLGSVLHPGPIINLVRRRLLQPHRRLLRRFHAWGKVFVRPRSYPLKIRLWTFPPPALPPELLLASLYPSPAEPLLTSLHPAPSASNQSHPGPWTPKTC